MRIRRWFFAALLITAALPAHVAAQHATITEAISDLEFRTGSGAWTPVSFAPQSVASGWGNSAVQFTMRMRLDWDADPPGTYGTNLRFTITS